MQSTDKLDGVKAQNGSAIMSELQRLLRDASTATERYEFANLIIQICIDRRDNEYYMYGKIFVRNYLESRYDKEANYEHINWDHILSVARHLDAKDRMQLVDFTIRECKRLNILVRNRLTKELNKARRAYLITSPYWYVRLDRLLEYLLLISTSSFLSLVIAVILIYAAQAAVLYPASDADDALFYVVSANLSENPLVNHVSNMLEYWSSETATMVVHPTGWGGALMMLIGTIVKVLVVVKYVFEELTRRIMA